MSIARDMKTRARDMLAGEKRDSDSLRLTVIADMKILAPIALGEPLDPYGRMHLKL